MPSSGGAPGTADRLSAYIRDYLSDRDESERALAARAVDPETGFALQHGWINQLIRARVSRAPELWRLRALAAAMSVPTSMLAQLAASQWLGVEVVEIQTGEEEWVSVTVPPGMSSEERQRFVRAAEDLAQHWKH
jgi:molecular chaperone DnaK (HSP70)